MEHVYFIDVRDLLGFGVIFWYTFLFEKGGVLNRW